MAPSAEMVSTPHRKSARYVHGGTESSWWPVLPTTSYGNAKNSSFIVAGIWIVECDSILVVAAMFILAFSAVSACFSGKPATKRALKQGHVTPGSHKFKEGTSFEMMVVRIRPLSFQHYL